MTLLVEDVALAIQDVAAEVLEPGSIAIAVTWIAALWLLNRAQHGLPWHAAGEAPVARSRRRHQRRQHRPSRHRVRRRRPATLVGGVLLEKSGDRIAAHLGMTGVLFGATFLAAATSLPEVSTGLSSVKMGDYKLAVSDIFGGDAFLPVLFLLAVLLSGNTVLQQAQDTDIYLTGLGVLLTTIYIWGLITRPSRRILGVDPDSLAVITV